MDTDVGLRCTAEAHSPPPSRLLTEEEEEEDEEEGRVFILRFGIYKMEVWAEDRSAHDVDEGVDTSHMIAGVE